MHVGQSVAASVARARKSDDTSVGGVPAGMGGEAESAGRSWREAARGPAVMAALIRR